MNILSDTLPLIAIKMSANREVTCRELEFKINVDTLLETPYPKGSFSTVTTKPGTRANC